MTIFRGCRILQPPVSEIASTFFGGVGIGKIPHFSVCSSMIYLGTGGSLVAARLSKGEFRLCALQVTGDKYMN